MRSFCCAHCSVSGSQRSPARNSARSDFAGWYFWMNFPSGSSRRMARNAVGAVKSVCTPRSEEHTSELQSRLHLVCRLLLEKKKKLSLERTLQDPVDVATNDTRHVRDLL